MDEEDRTGYSDRWYLITGIALRGSNMSWSFVCGSPDKGLLKTACREKLLIHRTPHSHLWNQGVRIADGIDVLIDAAEIPTDHMLLVRSHGHMDSWGSTQHVDIIAQPLPLGMILTPPVLDRDADPLRKDCHE